MPLTYRHHHAVLPRDNALSSFSYCRLASPDAYDRHSVRSDVFLTPEQQAVVDTDVRGGQILKVIAFAGTGKTTSLRAWAEKRPYLRILYIAVSLIKGGGSP